MDSINRNQPENEFPPFREDERPALRPGCDAPAARVGFLICLCFFLLTFQGTRPTFIIPATPAARKANLNSKELVQGKLATAASSLGFHVLAWTSPLEATPQPLPANARAPNHFARGRCHANTPIFGAGWWIRRSSHQCSQSWPKESAAPQLPDNQWDARVLLR